MCTHSANFGGTMRARPRYCIFGWQIQDEYIDASNPKWLDRMTQAQNTFIVVNGLIFAATFSAVASFDGGQITGTCDPGCEWGLRFRALSAAAFCCSATAIVVSAMMITALTIYNPDKVGLVKNEVLQALNVLSQFGGVMTTSAIILTLCAVFPAPLSAPGAQVPGSGADISLPLSVPDGVTIGVWFVASLALLFTLLLHFIALPYLLGFGGRGIYENSESLNDHTERHSQRGTIASTMVDMPPESGPAKEA